MAFGYIEGQANTIPAFFAAFEAFITSLGWTVVAGAGTTNLIINSTGEAGGLTKLFVNVYRDPFVPFENIYVEVQDDAVGTNVTTSGNYLRTAGNAIYYQMNGDKDALSIFVRHTNGQHLIYAGRAVPFEINEPDDEYSMFCLEIPAVGAAPGRILRDHTGAWDQNAWIGWEIPAGNGIPGAGPSVLDKTIPLEELYATIFYAGHGANYAVGQLKHLSRPFNHFNGHDGDELTTTGIGGSTAKWTVIRANVDATPAEYYTLAMQTQGAITTQSMDGAQFASVTGAPASLVDFLDNVLVPFMTARGYTVENYAPTSGYNRDYFFHSVGESGVDDIHIRVYQKLLANTFAFYSVTDITKAHSTTEIAYYFYNFTGNYTYYLCGDRDFVVCAYHKSGVDAASLWDVAWAGKLIPLTPDTRTGTPNTDYSVVRGFEDSTRLAVNTIELLRDPDTGTWGPGLVCDMAQSTYISYTAAGWRYLSSPSPFDGTTYLLLPFNVIYYPPIGSKYLNIGRLKYVYDVSGAALGSLDTVTCLDGQIFRVFRIYVGGGGENVFLALRMV